MLTVAVLILAVTQALTLSGLGCAVLRLARMNPATDQSHADMALIGTIDELLVEHGLTASARDELAQQRRQLVALLRDSEATAADEATPSFAMTGRPRR